MSTQGTNYPEPHIDGDGFVAFASGHLPEPESKLWEEIHEEVQRVLAALDEPVRASVADIRVTPGKTQGRGFYLFTHRTYSRTNVDVDPVVVGLTFTASKDSAHVIIQTDISGESGGDVIEALETREVPALRDELLRAARQAAQQLCEYSHLVAEALLSTSRTA